MRVVIGGGGTGGHLYAGIAVAQAFKLRDASTEILFLGSSSGIEVDVLPREGFPLSLIRVQGVVGKRRGAKIKALSVLPMGLLQALWILRRFQPDLVMGVGGYVAGPVVVAAFLLGIPRLIQEQNLFPGMTNRLLAHIVDRVAIAYPDSVAYFPSRKVVLTGNPVRTEIRQCAQSMERRVRQGERLHLLICGGSQGAHALNMAMSDALPELQELREYLDIVHQTGKADWNIVQEAYKSAGFCATVVPFIQAMGEAYARADLVICRAGATTLAEIAVCGKAALFIPYPYATHNHQEINAQNWQKAGAAEVILNTDLTGTILAERIRFFWEHRERLVQMEIQSKKMGNPDAADQIVDLCYKLTAESRLLTVDR